MVKRYGFQFLFKKIKALFLHINHFCLIWKSENVSFKQTIIELKENFEVVDKYMTEENVNSHFEYIYIHSSKKSIKFD